jgi:hypothetical protein
MGELRYSSLLCSLQAQPLDTVPGLCFAVVLVLLQYLSQALEALVLPQVSLGLGHVPGPAFQYGRPLLVLV